VQLSESRNAGYVDARNRLKVNGSKQFGKELCSKGTIAVVVLIKNTGNISSYQGVVIGSAIYMGKWMPEAGGR
jgi:hypothetical protein